MIMTFMIKMVLKLKEFPEFVMTNNMDANIVITQRENGDESSYEQIWHFDNIYALDLPIGLSRYLLRLDSTRHTVK